MHRLQKCTMQSSCLQAPVARPSRSPMPREVAIATASTEEPLLEKTRSRKVAQRTGKPDLNTTALYRARSHMPLTQQEIDKILADPRSMPDSDDEEDLDEWKVGFTFLKLYFACAIHAIILACVARALLL